MFSRIVSLCCVALVAASCQQAGPPVFSDADRAANRAVSDAWLKAVRAADWAAVAAVYTPDAMILPTNAALVTGRDNIQAFFAAYPHIVEFNLDPVEIEGLGDVAYVRGTYDLKVAVNDTLTVPDRGKYLEIRRKQADGSWLISRDMWNSDEPPAH